MASITWLGHSGFVIECQGRKIAVDAWLDAPTFSGTDLSDVEVVLVSHGHHDHCESAPEVCNASGALLLCIHEITFWAKAQGVPAERVVGMNKGGTYERNGWRFTMVDAVHSSGCPDGGRGPAHGDTVYGGEAAAWVIECPDGDVVYHAGDTAVFGDMALIAKMHKPLIALLPIGGHFTMGPEGAAHAIELLGVDHVVPMHYGTFPSLAGTPERLRALVGPGIHVHELSPGQTMDLRPLVRHTSAPVAPAT